MKANDAIQNAKDSATEEAANAQSDAAWQVKAAKDKNFADLNAFKRNMREDEEAAQAAADKRVKTAKDADATALADAETKFAADCETGPGAKPCNEEDEQKPKAVEAALEVRFQKAEHEAKLKSVKALADAAAKIKKEL